jgi:hypothetical protein
VPAVTADEMTSPTHLTTLGPIGRSRVVVRFGSPESALTATAPAGLFHAQPHALCRVLRTRPRIMAGTTAGPATTLRRSVKGASSVRNQTNRASRQ